MILEEITTRLEQAVSKKVPFVERLRPALTLACRQLEILSPALLAINRRGLLDGGFTANVERGTILIVLANPAKVLTLHFLPPAAGLTRFAVLMDCIEEARSVFKGGAPRPEDVISGIEWTAQEYGGVPGELMPNVSTTIAARTLGLLFMHQPDLERLCGQLTQIIETGTCPLYVGLTGEGKGRNKVCGAWPIVLPFGPYIQNFDQGA